MMLIFEIRAKLTEIYQKHDFIIKSALKFLLMFFSLTKLTKTIGYNSSLSKSMIVILLSAVSAFLPSSLIVFVAILYVFLQIMTASILIAVTVVMIFLVLYLFFLRFTPKEGLSIIATPLLCSLGFPYAVPLFLGMFGSILSVVPAACGVVAYYLLRAVKDNIVTIDQLKHAKDGALPFYLNILDNLLKNPPMYVMIAVFAIVIIAIVLVRSIQMDYSFEISLGVGTGVMILAFIIGSLKYDMAMPLGSVLLKSLISMGIVFVCLFFYRVLNYSAAEHVQFEDERYYYYVRAVPKITAGSPKKKIRKVMTQKNAQNALEEEDEEEAMEAMESMLARKDNANANQLTPGLAKRLRKDVAPKPEPSYDEEDEDDDDEVVITGPKSDSESRFAFVAEGAGKAKDFVKGLFKSKGNGKKKPVIDEEDSEEDEETGVSYFAENSEASSNEESSDEPEDDYE